MIRITLDLELLSDVSCAKDARSLGAGEAYPFIPGRALWGVLATRLYARDPARAPLLVFGGGVRVRDALPVIDGDRAVVAPLTWHGPKNAVETRLTDLARESRPSDTIEERKGWVTAKGAWKKQPIDTLVTLRTAIAADGRARDAHLFAIESIRSGSHLRGHVDVDDDSAADLVMACIDGEASVGRSRYSEFGLIRVRTTRNPFPPESRGVIGSSADVRLLCVSRLLLRDDVTGAPRLVPTATDVGLTGDFALDLGRSVIRTSRHSPFNGRHARPETERQCIEAGSVFVFHRHSGALTAGEFDAVVRACDRGIGEQVHQGFGEVWPNPDLLFSVDPKPPAKSEPRPKPTEPNDELFRWAKAKAGGATTASQAFKWAVAEADNVAYQSSTSAQWGTIAALAHRHQRWNELDQALTKHISDGVTRREWGDPKYPKSAGGAFKLSYEALESEAWSDAIKIDAIVQLASLVQRKRKQDNARSAS